MLYSLLVAPVTQISQIRKQAIDEDIDAHIDIATDRSKELAHAGASKGASQGPDLLTHLLARCHLEGKGSRPRTASAEGLHSRKA